MLPTTACKMIAQYSEGGVSGLRASYPRPTQINPPHLILFWSDTDNTIGGGSEQYWRMTVYGQLCVGALGIPEKEVLRAEQVIAPIMDVFTPDDAGSAAFHLEVLNAAGSGYDRVDHCILKRAVASQEITVAGQRFYGAELWFEVLLRRFAGSP